MVLNPINSIHAITLWKDISFCYSILGVTFLIQILNDKDYKITIDKLYLWDFQVEIKDKFGTKTYTFQVPKGMPIMMIDVVLISVGINCFPTKANSFFVNGYDFNNLHPVNSIIATTNNSNPSSNVTGTWELLTSTTINNNTIYYWKRTA